MPAPMTLEVVLEQPIRGPQLVDSDGGGLTGRDRAEDWLEGGREQEQAGSRAQHGGSSAVRVTE